MQAVALNANVYEEANKPALIILHGLLGSARNWRYLATQFAEDYQVHALDLRNHGDSPHLPSMDYPTMTADVIAYMDAQGLYTATVLGHSMGGKVAMWLALTAPERVQRLIVVDIAPVTYVNHFKAIFSGLQSLPLAHIQSRQEADRHLSPTIREPSVRQFLLQNLLGNKGQFVWRVPLDFIESALPEIMAFPDTQAMSACSQPALFIGGQQSDYLLPEFHSAILQLFPLCRMETIADAGHWVHAQQPQKLLEVIRPFSSEVDAE